MNKITLLLQDKETVLELAKEPEVKIKIADAIVDGVKKRSMKNFADIEYRIKKEFQNLLFDGSWSTKFREEHHKKIKEGLKPIIDDIIKDAQTSCFERINKSFIEISLMAEEKIKELDIEMIIREEARNVIEQKLLAK